MITNTLKELFKKNLEQLKNEIELYHHEANLWRVDGQIKNSAGNLCLHLMGNLKAYIGVGLAKTNYIRQRDLEFSLKNIPGKDLCTQIDETIQIIEDGLNNLTSDQLQETFPIKIWEKPTSIENTLVLLATHLNYHLGQINYHRRIIDDENK
ncbi:MAG: DUF1572 family protein [Bacteroidetes bacterium]|nr:DUF1572 family protein [Bacteroidota bacterium]